MEFLRYVKGCTRSVRLYNDDTREELEIVNIQDCITKNKERLTAHLNTTLDGVLVIQTCCVRGTGSVGEVGPGQAIPVSYTHLYPTFIKLNYKPEFGFLDVHYKTKERRSTQEQN